MEEAVQDLRSAVRAALSVAPPDGLHGTSERDCAAGDDDLLHQNVPAGHPESEGTCLSSLSGSLPSDRSGAAARRRNYYAATTAHGRTGAEEGSHNGSAGRHDMGRRRRLEVAAQVGNAVSNCEVALYNFHQDGVPSQIDVSGEGHAVAATNDGAHANDMVDLLVAVLTSVPRTLLNHASVAGEGANPQQEEEYLASLEQMCFNAVCIASDVVRRYFLRPMLDADVPPVLEDRHVHELIDEIMHVCNAYHSDGMWPANFDPIVSVLNSLCEGRQVERAIEDREGNGYGRDDGYQTPFACLDSKDCLRLVHTLMYRHLCEKEQEHESDAASGQVCSFIGHLLEHFANMTTLEMGHESSEEHTASLFETWADGADEHVERRLTDDEAREVYDLVVRYHVGSIQTTLQQLENAEVSIGTALAESEENDGIDDDTLEGLVAALQETVRHVAVVVAETEAMDKLGLEHDPEIHVIFHPLVVCYARFVASSMHDAMMLLRRTCGGTNEGEEVPILADDLLFRLCRVSIGMDFLQSSNNAGEVEEVLALCLLRAMNSQCIDGKARFLLDVAADRAQVQGKAAEVEPASKRQRYDSMRCCAGKPTGGSSEEKQGDMVDVRLACLALTQSTQGDEDPDPSTVAQASCIASALMARDESELGKANDDQVLLDPLNPWHTLQVKPLQKLADFDHSSIHGDAATPSDSLLSYALSTPHLFDTKSSD